MCHPEEGHIGAYSQRQYASNMGQYGQIRACPYLSVFGPYWRWEYVPNMNSISAQYGQICSCPNLSVTLTAPVTWRAPAHLPPTSCSPVLAAKVATAYLSILGQDLCAQYAPNMGQYGQICACPNLSVSAHMLPSHVMSSRSPPAHLAWPLQVYFVHILPHIGVMNMQSQTHKPIFALKYG